MIANYHTHTWRCNHASGTEEEYVRTAIDRNLEILGFSDHTPYFFPEDYYSGFRMRPEQLAGYCETIRALQKQYSGQIRIHLGAEVEYYPDLIPELLPVLRDHGIEYILLGQHFIGNEIDQPYSGAPTADASILKAYCRQSMEAMNTGLFTYFAHPDLIKFVGSDGLYREQMRHLCREAKGCGIPLEINMLGSWTNRNYPDIRFWELAAEEGCRVILGCDAHSPRELNNLQTQERLTGMAADLGIRLLSTTELVPL